MSYPAPERVSPGIRNTFMISAPASRLPIADVVKGIFKLLAGDGYAVLPTAFARSHLAQVVVRPVHNLAEPTLHSEPAPESGWGRLVPTSCKPVVSDGDEPSPPRFRGAKRVKMSGGVSPSSFGVKCG
jgi:hypothetical protein